MGQNVVDPSRVALEFSDGNHNESEQPAIQSEKVETLRYMAGQLFGKV